MGGFVFDTSSAPAKFLLHDTTRLTINLKGLRYIAKHAPSLIPDMSKEDIRDKSKADSLAKTLVCLQASWFCVQCIVRVVQEQDISFLELNTFAHAVCTLLVYALWWHKPLDVESPSLLIGDEAWEMCAMMYVTSNGESPLNDLISRLLSRRNFSFFSENFCETEMSRGQRYGDNVIAQLKDIFDGRHLARLWEHQTQPRAILRWDPIPDSLSTIQLDIRSHSLSSESVQVRKGDSIFGFRCIEVYTIADWYRAFLVLPVRSHMAREVRKECTFSSLDLKRWELVSRGWQKYRPKFQEYDPFTQSFGRCLYNGINRRMRNWATTSWDFLIGSITLDIRLLTFSITAAVYGGLHLLAWEAPFGSEAEQFMWRASASLLTISGFILLLDNPLRIVTDFLWPGLSGRELLSEFTYITFWIQLILFMLGFAIAYILARVFLIVECCLQLARLPPGAYTMPDWSKYFPHIS